MNKALWNYCKIGTLILSYYRSGTHFLHDAICDTIDKPVVSFDEICNDNTINELLEIQNNTDPTYKICILNNICPKYYLTPEILRKWHVIHLTRNDKIQQFISHWVWAQNSLDERINNTSNFKHHGTPAENYQSLLADKRNYDIENVIAWLAEQPISYHLHHDVEIDYNELPIYASNNIKWNPNQYNFKLQDLFTNYQEIENLLTNFKFTNVK